MPEVRKLIETPHSMLMGMYVKIADGISIQKSWRFITLIATAKTMILATSLYSVLLVIKFVISFQRLAPGYLIARV